jgi:hypothetical protein
VGGWIELGARHFELYVHLHDDAIGQCSRQERVIVPSLKRERLSSISNRAVSQNQRHQRTRPAKFWLRISRLIQKSGVVALSVARFAALPIDTVAITALFSLIAFPERWAGRRRPVALPVDPALSVVDCRAPSKTPTARLVPAGINACGQGRLQCVPNALFDARGCE